MADNTRALTAKIVTAYLRNNEVAVTDVPNLIQVTYAALFGTGAPAPVLAESQSPAVSIRKSVSPDAITCLECGKHQKMLRRHLATGHGLSVEQYRTKWNLPADYPMTAPKYAQKRSDLAIAIGLGRKPKPPTEGDAPPNPPRHSYPASRWSKPKT